MVVGVMMWVMVVCAARGEDGSGVERRDRGSGLTGVRGSCGRVSRDRGRGGGVAGERRRDGCVGGCGRSGRRGAGHGLVNIELHVVRVEALVRDGLRLGLRLEALRVLLGGSGGDGVSVRVVRCHGLLSCGGERRGGGREGLLRSVGIKDNDVALFEVLDEGVEICEVEPTTCVITALR